MTRSRTGLLALLLIAAACTGDDAASPCLPLVDGVPVARNDMRSVSARIRLEELWRRGGTRADEVLAQPVAVVAAADGRVAIPDFELAEVIVVEADGTWRGAVTRTGEGPGEVLAPIAAAWVGTDLLVFDVLTSRTVRITAAGEAGEAARVDPRFTAPVVARGEIGGAALQPPGSPILTTRLQQPTATGTYTDRVVSAALRHDAITGRTDTVAAAPHPIVLVPGWGEVAAPGWAQAVAAVGGTHLGVAAADGSYRIMFHDTTGAPRLQVCGPGGPLPLDGRELGADAAAAYAGLRDAFALAPRPAAPAALGRLVVTAEGGLWVQRERPSRFAPGESVLGVPGATYDLFDPDGRYTGTLTAPASARIQAVAGERVWALRTDTLDAIWLVAYRIISS